ncbi:hypothetical protein KBZ21_39790, partial [Streptomyces sp. A73]|nr:hypothetical protein [Streptomyces sp. A73]
RAERRCRRFGGAWADVMRLALWVRDGEPPERSRRIECVWRDPEKARREIEKLRKEAAKYRTTAKELEPLAQKAREAEEAQKS